MSTIISDWSEYEGRCKLLNISAKNINTHIYIAREVVGRKTKVTDVKMVYQSNWVIGVGRGYPATFCL